MLQLISDALCEFNNIHSWHPYWFKSSSQKYSITIWGLGLPNPHTIKNPYLTFDSPKT